MIRINPPIPLMTPKGNAYAYFVIDYGIEEDFCGCVLLMKQESVGHLRMVR